MVSPSRVASSRSASVTNRCWSTATSGSAADDEVHHEPPDDRGYGAVAPVGFRGQERLGPGGVLERHPDTGVHRAFVVQGKQLAQQG